MHRGDAGVGVVPLVAEFRASKNWKNWLNDAERNHPRFASSQRRRRRVEKVFSWIKTVAGLRQTKLRGTETSGLAVSAHRRRPPIWYAW